MNIEQAINLLVTITLIEMMATIGLGVTWHELSIIARNWRLALRAVAANYIMVPAACLGLLLLFKASPLVSVGFLILAVCPGAPYGPPFTAVAKGNVSVAVVLMVLLAGSSAVVAPLLLRVLLPIMAADSSLKIDPWQLASTLIVTQLLPLCAAMTLRQWWTALALRIKRPAEWLSKVLNLAAVGLIIVSQFQLLLEIPPRGFAGMLLLLIASGVAGWLVSGRDTGVARAMIVTTSLRNVAVGLVIAAGCFPGTPALTAVVSYGLLSLLATLVMALVLGSLPVHSPSAPEENNDKHGE